MALGTRTKFQLEILIKKKKIFAIQKFRENILESLRKISETTPCSMGWMVSDSSCNGMGGTFLYSWGLCLQEFSCANSTLWYVIFWTTCFMQIKITSLKTLQRHFESLCKRGPNHWITTTTGHVFALIKGNQDFLATNIIISNGHHKGYIS